MSDLDGPCEALTDSVELERYELFADPNYHFGLDRRNFMKIFGGGIALIIPLSTVVSQQGEPQRAAGESGSGAFTERLPNEIGAWIHIDQDGGVTVYTGKVEMGQNIRTSLTQVVAEELHAPISMIRLQMADTELTPFDAGTFGSRTTPTMAPHLRRAAAAAREFLIELAAEQWNIERNAIEIVNARFVNHDTTKSLSFADVAKGRKLVKTIPDNIATTPVKQWTIAGTSVLKVQAGDFVTGKHQYTSDVRREGMLHGKVVRPASFNAILLSATTNKAEAMTGVTVVRDGNFIGVAAPDQLTATRAANAITAQWKAAAQPSNSELFDYLKKNPAAERGAERGGGSRPRGPITEGLAAAEKRL